MQGRASASTITGLLVRQPQQTRPIAVLINAVLYNLSSSTDSLRGRAHTLLCSLARVVKMEGAEVDLHPHDGIYLPESHSNLISTISDRFSIASPAYSLAFIDECTYTISIASLDELPTFIHALRPFLHNLHNLGYTARSERAAVEASIKAFVRQLFLISLRQPLVSFSFVVIDHDTDCFFRCIPFYRIGFSKYLEKLNSFFLSFLMKHS